MDGSPPEGLNTSAKLLAPEACPEDRLNMRKVQAVASSTRERVPRVYDLEGNLRVEHFPWAPLGTTPFLRVRGICFYRCRLGDIGLIFAGEFRLHSFRCCFAAGRPRFREKAACCYSHPHRVGAC